MALTLFCTLAHFHKHNVTFIKLGTNDANRMTSWCYCFPRYNVFGCFSLKETENLLNIWCKIKIYFYLTPTFNKYPLFIMDYILTIYKEDFCNIET